jgi:hypothetical protein
MVRWFELMAVSTSNDPPRNPLRWSSYPRLPEKSDRKTENPSNEQYDSRRGNNVPDDDSQNEAHPCTPGDKVAEQVYDDIDQVTHAVCGIGLTI